MAFGNATKGYVKKHSGGGGGGGTTNYSELTNKPQINGVTLDGNKTSEELNIGGGGGFDNITVLLNSAGTKILNELPKNGILFIVGDSTGGGTLENSYQNRPYFVPTPFLKLACTYNFDINNNPLFNLAGYNNSTYNANIKKLSNGTYELRMTGSNTCLAYAV